MLKSQNSLYAAPLHRPFETATKKAIALGTHGVKREIWMEFPKRLRDDMLRWNRDRQQVSAVDAIAHHFTCSIFSGTRLNTRLKIS